jgi:hypothetical protein
MTCVPPMDTRPLVVLKDRRGLSGLKSPVLPRNPDGLPALCAETRRPRREEGGAATPKGEAARPEGEAGTKDAWLGRWG